MIRDDFWEAVEDVRDYEVPELPSEYADDEELIQLKNGLGELMQVLQRGAQKLQEEADQVLSKISDATLRWGGYVARRTEEYLKWLSEQGGDRSVLQRRRQNLAKECDELSSLVRDLKSKVENLPEQIIRRNKLLDDLDIAVQKLFHLRKQKYDSISHGSRGRLKLDLIPGGNRSLYLQELMQMKRGSNLRETDIRHIAESISPRQLVDSVLEDDAESIEKFANISKHSAEKLVKRFQAYEQFSEVLAIQHLPLLKDLPQIRFLKEDGEYHELGKLSIGQKCTALLIIALAEGDRPVIIDQPEDALDIQSIYEDVTLQLRGRKATRQFILTTHNPTVAVTSDSDQFHVLKGTADKGEISAQGAIDHPEVRAEVIQHLEGGPSSLQLKTRKYRLFSE